MHSCRYMRPVPGKASQSRGNQSWYLDFLDRESQTTHLMINRSFLTQKITKILDFKVLSRKSRKFWIRWFNETSQHGTKDTIVNYRYSRAAILKSIISDHSNVQRYFESNFNSTSQLCDTISIFCKNKYRIKFSTGVTISRVPIVYYTTLNSLTEH